MLNDLAFVTAAAFLAFTAYAAPVALLGNGKHPFNITDPKIPLRLIHIPIDHERVSPAPVSPVHRIPWGKEGVIFILDDSDPALDPLTEGSNDDLTLSLIFDSAGLNDIDVPAPAPAPSPVAAHSLEVVQKQKQSVGGTHNGALSER